ncbi:hypothetical protein [Kribbella sp. NPDC050470]|uniref:hypothetical protein n=1 Tax=unclassified Kribbella TaxID=2644121 RepID=UPI00379E4A7C
MPDLRAVVVIDYQNVHLTGHQRFEKTKYGPKHEVLVDPLFFAQQLLHVRNSRQRPGYPHAVLRRVDVYRGEPSPDHEPKAYARNQAQKAHWERDKRVTVTLRPLKYRYLYDGDGKALRDPVTGTKIPSGPPSEKGVDVLCALALVRHALRDDVDLVILASLDSDLVPAIDEVLALRAAKVETFSWYVPGDNSYELRPSDRTHWIWNTRLTETNFLNCLDRTHYS